MRRRADARPPATSASRPATSGSTPCAGGCCPWWPPHHGPPSTWPSDDPPDFTRYSSARDRFATPLRIVCTNTTGRRPRCGGSSPRCGTRIRFSRYQPVDKRRLRPPYGVAASSKVLTYARYAALFEFGRALSDSLRLFCPQVVRRPSGASPPRRRAGPGRCRAGS